MKWVKIREKIGVLAALVLVFILFVVISVVAGWDIPVVSDIANSLGLKN